MRVDLRSQHDLGEIVGYAYRLYAAHFRALFLIALITAPLQLLAIVVTRQIEDDAAAQSVGLFLQLPDILVGLIAGAALIYAVHEITGGTPADPGRSLDHAFERLGALFTTALLFAGLLIAAAFAAPLLALWWLIRRDATIDGERKWWLALIPGVLFFYLAIRWGFNVQAVMMEGKRNWSALDVSSAAVRGNWWRVLGILVVIGLIQIGPLMIASVSTLAAPIVEGLITSLTAALVLPFAAAAQTLLYYDLKARNRVDVSPAALDSSEPDVHGEGP